MYDHDEVQERLALYLMGDLPATEADAVGSHLEVCELCSNRLVESAEILALAEEYGRRALSGTSEVATRSPYWPVVIKAAGLILAFVLGLKAGGLGHGSAPRSGAQGEERGLPAETVEMRRMERVWMEASKEAKTPLARLIVATKKLN